MERSKRSVGFDKQEEVGRVISSNTIHMTNIWRANSVTFVRDTES